MLAKDLVYRVFKRKTWCFEHLLGHQKCTFKSYKQNMYIPEMRKFDLWPLDLVESNIHGLHSLQQKEFQISIKYWIFDDPFHIERPG